MKKAFIAITTVFLLYGFKREFNLVKVLLYTRIPRYNFTVYKVPVRAMRQ
jgi:hypothetical protein